MIEAHAVSSASPAAAWRLLAEPRRWSSWAPHIRGAIGLGSPEVEAGRIGLVIVGLATPIPVRVAAKSDGSTWDWSTGLVRVRHSVAAHPDGCVVSVAMTAPAGIEGVLRSTYGRALPLLLRNLARVAERA